MVLAHYHSARLAIDELALPSILMNANPLSFQQLNQLDVCISSLKSWFENFFTFTPTLYFGFPFTIFSQLVRFLGTVYQLLDITSSNFPRELIFETLDPLNILDQLTNNLEQVAMLVRLENPSLRGRDREENKFAKLAHNMRALKSTWEAKMRGDERVETSLPTPPDGNEVLLGDVTMEGLDNDWLTDFLQF